MTDYLQRFGIKNTPYILQVRGMGDHDLIYIAKNNSYTTDWKHALTFCSEDEAYEKFRNMIKSKEIDTSIEQLKINPKCQVINFAEQN